MNTDAIQAGRFVSRWYYPAAITAGSDAERFDRLHAAIAGGLF